MAALTSGLLPLTLVCFSVLFLVACSPQPANKSAEINPFKTINTSHGTFAQTQAGYNLAFPKDHGPHPNFGIEWWYITANLSTENADEYGLQWTLFRIAQPDIEETPWSNNQRFMAHVALHGPEHSWFEQKFARGGVGNAVVNASPFSAQLDNWALNATHSESKLFPATLKVSIQSNIAINLNLNADKPLVLHGEQGFSKKFYQQPNAAAPASYYYSQPHIEIKGQLSLDNQEVAVNGVAWFDHEWTSQVLPPNATGWDWFAMHLNDGSKLMLARVRHASQQHFWFGTYVDSEGQTHVLEANDITAKAIEFSRVAGRKLPLAWKISVSKFNIDLATKPIKTDQWVPGLVAYYEGAIAVSGSHSGKGFMELTGY